MNISLMLKGAAMGIAEAIPGVSGGTIAFITGIYEELLDTIKGIQPANLKLIFSDRKAFWKAINGPFLIWLLLGMGAGLVFGVLVISHLLETQKEILWGLFFGLVLGAAIYLGKGVKWNWQAILALIIGTIASYLVTTLIPSTGSDHPLYLFLSGAIAISALMLPGISGSFLLLILGLYAKIVETLKAVLTEFDFSGIGTLMIFGAGVLVGLFTFARVLSWLFKSYRNTTMATMIGILIGSLNKLWPWKKITAVYAKLTDSIEFFDGIALVDGENYKVLSESNLLPSQYATYADPKLIWVSLAVVIGFIAVIGASRLSPSE